MGRLHGEPGGRQGLGGGRWRGGDVRGCIVGILSGGGVGCERRRGREDDPEVLV